MLNFFKKNNSLPEIPELKNFEKSLMNKIKNMSMTSIERQFSLIKSIQYIADNKISGDIVECGVWRGGNMVMVAEMLKRLKTFRKLWLYDTYEGMTKPSKFDLLKDQAVQLTKFKEYKLGNNSSDWCFCFY